MKELSLETLGGLDEGYSTKMINTALQAMMQDVEDRGDDGKVRKTIITIEAKKLHKERDAVVVTANAKNVLPSYQIAGTVCNLMFEGGKVVAVFNENNPENPDQKTIYDAQ